MEETLKPVLQANKLVKRYGRVTAMVPAGFNADAQRSRDLLGCQAPKQKLGDLALLVRQRQVEPIEPVSRRQPRPGAHQRQAV